MLENSEFPELNTVSLDSYFQEKLVTLYFYSVRSCAENIPLLETCWNEVLETLVLHIDHYSDYVDLFYKLVLYIRKTGEHDITYMIVWKWQQFFPNLVKLLIKECFNWRDVVYFCDYIKKNSNDNRNSNTKLAIHAENLIQHCVDMINTQLLADLDSWKFSIHAGSRNHISNVAKWIPRENKKHTWLFELLVIDWINRKYPYFLKTTTRDYSYDAAILKGKRLYRKQVSNMNKALQTVQIKQCAKQISDISPKVVSKYTSMKQPKLMEQIKDNKDYSGSREHGQTMNKHLSFQLPISYFIKEALRGSITIHDEWAKYYSTNKTFFGSMLPILDISDKVQSESNETYYTAIGIALLICELTSTMRILAIGENPVWIVLDSKMSFVERVNFIHQKCSGCQGSRPDKLNDLIQTYISETNSNILPKLVLLSDYSTPQFIQLSIDESSPYQYIYWNLSAKHKFENIDNLILPGSAFQSNIKFLSGYTFTPSIFQNSNHSYDLVRSMLDRF